MSEAGVGETIAEVVEFLAKSVIPDGGDLSVTSTVQDGRVDVELAVPSSDLGRVIGRNGQTITAIRTLASFAGRHQQLRVNVDAVESTAGPSATDDKEESS